ncbi:class I SAM-dependent methyltransferase [Azonexus sp.]|uniref:class I SAM-dependent methyltransferase n=1 Tax=Azonexus sp. TaxID=1872668 RepID=UPI0035AF37A1
MKIADPACTDVCNEVRLMQDELPFDGARVLELGCGRAEKTRALAATGRPREILALEVDAVQHARNLELGELPGIRFHRGGAEAIPAADGSVDIVLMLKSLHHVPVELMDRALAEIARVLRPGGLAWISEPVYAGDLNDVMRLFHDEKTVREAAFAAVCRAVEGGSLRLVRQLFFNTRSHFDDFAQFDARMIRVTHTDHRLSPELYAEVQARFAAQLTPAGATFYPPQRVDLLQKPA